MNDEHPFLRATRLSNEAALARNWDALAGSMAESFEVEDRRQGFRTTYTAAENLEQVRVILDLGIVRIGAELIEAQGERCALIRLEFEADNGFVVPALVVGEVNEDGRILRGVVFDEDDLEAARAELGRF